MSSWFGKAECSCFNYSNAICDGGICFQQCYIMRLCSHDVVTAGLACITRQKSQICTVAVLRNVRKEQMYLKILNIPIFSAIIQQVNWCRTPYGYGLLCILIVWLDNIIWLCWFSLKFVVFALNGETYKVTIYGVNFMRASQWKSRTSLLKTVARKKNIPRPFEMCPTASAQFLHSMSVFLFQRKCHESIIVANAR